MSASDVFQRNFNWQALAALASGNTVGEQLGGANNVMAQQQVQAREMQQVNQTRNELLKMYPEYAGEINAADGPTLGNMLRTAWQQRMEAQQPRKPNFLNLGNGYLFNADTQLTSLGDNTAARLGTPGNYLKSEDYQQAEQAGREFLAVVLRKDTGAAVTDAEMDLYGPMYLPQPGDKPPVIKQKAEARKRFMEGLGLGIPERLRKTVPGADSLYPADANAVTTPDPTTAQPKQIILQDGTQGTIRRTK